MSEPLTVASVLVLWNNVKDHVLEDEEKLDRVDTMQSNMLEAYPHVILYQYIIQHDKLGRKASIQDTIDCLTVDIAAQKKKQQQLTDNMKTIEHQERLLEKLQKAFDCYMKIMTQFCYDTFLQPNEIAKPGFIKHFFDTVSFTLALRCYAYKDYVRTGLSVELNLLQDMNNMTNQLDDRFIHTDTNRMESKSREESNKRFTTYRTTLTQVVEKNQWQHYQQTLITMKEKYHAWNTEKLKIENKFIQHVMDLETTRTSLKNHGYLSTFNITTAETHVKDSILDSLKDWIAFLEKQPQLSTLKARCGRDHSEAINQIRSQFGVTAETADVLTKGYDVLVSQCLGKEARVFLFMNEGKRLEEKNHREYESFLATIIDIVPADMLQDAKSKTPSEDTITGVMVKQMCKMIPNFVDFDNDKESSENENDPVTNTNQSNRFIKTSEHRANPTKVIFYYAKLLDVATFTCHLIDVLQQQPSIESSLTILKEQRRLMDNGTLSKKFKRGLYLIDDCIKQVAIDTAIFGESIISSRVIMLDTLKNEMGLVMQREMKGFEVGYATGYQACKDEVLAARHACVQGQGVDPNLLNLPVSNVEMKHNLQVRFSEWCQSISDQLRKRDHAFTYLRDTHFFESKLHSAVTNLSQNHRPLKVIDVIQAIVDITPFIVV